MYELYVIEKQDSIKGKDLALQIPFRVTVTSNFDTNAPKTLCTGKKSGFPKNWKQLEVALRCVRKTTQDSNVFCLEKNMTINFWKTSFKMAPFWPNVCVSFEPFCFSSWFRKLKLGYSKKEKQNIDKNK